MLSGKSLAWHSMIPCNAHVLAAATLLMQLGTKLLEAVFAHLGLCPHDEQQSLRL
jgi:hypothetical protein